MGTKQIKWKISGAFEFGWADEKASEEVRDELEAVWERNEEGVEFKADKEDEEDKNNDDEEAWVFRVDDWLDRVKLLTISGLFKWEPNQSRKLKDGCRNRSQESVERIAYLANELWEAASPGWFPIASPLA